MSFALFPQYLSSKSFFANFAEEGFLGVFSPHLSWLTSLVSSINLPKLNMDAPTEVKELAILKSIEILEDKIVSSYEMLMFLGTFFPSIYFFLSGCPEQTPQEV